MDFQKEDIKAGAASSLGPDQREGPAHTEQLQRTADLAQLDAPPSHHHKDPHHTSTRHCTQTRSPLVGQQTHQHNMYPNFLLHLLTFGPTSVSSSRQIQTFHSNGRGGKYQATHTDPQAYTGCPRRSAPADTHAEQHLILNALSEDVTLLHVPAPLLSSVVTRSGLSLRLFLYFSRPHTCRRLYAFQVTSQGSLIQPSEISMFE